jgi:hypothetical protein
MPSIRSVGKPSGCGPTPDLATRCTILCGDPLLGEFLGREPHSVRDLLTQPAAG